MRAVPRLDIPGGEAPTLAAHVGHHEPGVDEAAQVDDTESQNHKNRKQEGQFHKRYPALVVPPLTVNPQLSQHHGPSPPRVTIPGTDEHDRQLNSSFR